MTIILISAECITLFLYVTMVLKYFFKILIIDLFLRVVFTLNISVDLNHTGKYRFCHSNLMITFVYVDAPSLQKTYLLFMIIKTE